MPEDINAWTVGGRLTRDPELRETGSGTTVCQLRIASNRRIKNGDEWEDTPNYFDLTLFGNYAEAMGKMLEKGQQVTATGTARWSEWGEDDDKRQGVQMIVSTLTPGRRKGEGGSGQKSSSTPPPEDAF